MREEQNKKNKKKSSIAYNLYYVFDIYYNAKPISVFYIIFSI